MKRLLPLLLLALCLTGCRTAAPPLDYRALVRAADRLGMDIGPKDHHALYLEAAEWLGTPYRSGGQSRRGTDCSGFVRQVYKAAYGIDLPRSTDQQVDATRRVRRRKLREGDLVFFHGRKRRRVSHVGIYLKDGKFIHASTKGRQVHPRQHQPRRHGQPPQRGLLGRALDAGRKDQSRL